MIIGFCIERETLAEGKRVKLVHRLYALNEYHQQCSLPAGEKETYRTVEGAQAACHYLTRLFVHPTVQFLVAQDASIVRYLARALRERLARSIYVSDIDDLHCETLEEDGSLSFSFSCYEITYRASLSVDHIVTL